MQIITIILFIILLMYVVLKKRKFDFFSIATLSFVLYYFPVFIGHLRNIDTGNSVNISNKTYLCIIVFGSILLFFMLFFDKYYIKRFNRNSIKIVNTNIINSKNELSNLCIFILSIFGLVLMFITIVNYGMFINNFNKVKLLMNANKVTEYMKYIGLFVFVYSFIFKGKFINLCRINSLIIILYTFLLGHRSFIVIGIIAIFMHFVGTKESVRLIDIIKRNRKKFVLIILCLLFFLFVKNIFAAFLSGNYELVLTRLSDKNYYVDTLLESESNIIMNNLNNIVTYGFKYDFFDFILGILSLIPLIGGKLLNMVNYTSFETKMNYAFNSHFNEGIGIGSNYIGEAYSIGNIFFLIFITIFTLLFIKFLISKRNDTYNPFIYVFISIVLTYFTFYIHRNSLVFLLTTARAYLYILLLLMIMHAILGKKLLVRSKTNEK